jgi:hypothetical protein
MYRSLMAGFCFFWSMVFGGAIGMFCFMPPISSGDRETDVWHTAGRAVVGVVLGGIAWKAWEDRHAPLRNS